MKASGSLIFEWLDSAMAALVTDALSISSLLLMFGVRHNYMLHGKVVHCVTCECDMRKPIFSRKSRFQQDFEGLAVVRDPMTSTSMNSL